MTKRTQQEEIQEENKLELITGKTKIFITPLVIGLYIGDEIVVTTVGWRESVPRRTAVFLSRGISYGAKSAISRISFTYNADGNIRESNDYPARIAYITEEMPGYALLDKQLKDGGYNL